MKAFERETAVVRDDSRELRFLGELSEEWCTISVPQGGIVAGLAARAMAGGGMPDWWAPSADLTVHLLGDHRADWVLARNRARHAGDGYASLEVELWDADTATLVAFGTQMTIFTFSGGPPPPELRIPRDLR